MKRLLKLLTISFISLFILSLNLKTKFQASSDALDYIPEYDITVDPRIDGTLDIKIHIKWEVLDSTSDGPLTWVKVGVPNCYVDELKIESSSIKKIKYYADSGSYIRLDLRKKYYQNESVDLDFSFHLSRMYHLYDEECYYHYVPGWFTDIRVGKMTLRWNMQNVISTSSNRLVGDYYVIEKTNMAPGETMEIEVTYRQASFEGLSSDKTFSSRYMDTKAIIKIVIFWVFVVGVIVAIFIIIAKKADPYLSNRGFCGYHYWFYRPFFRRRYVRRSGVNRHGVPFVSSNNGSHSSGGGHCACACACACAGGGRAGCSRKDFYHTNIQVEEVKKHLK